MSEKNSLEEYQYAGNEIYEKLHFQSYPIGIKYSKSRD